MRVTEQIDALETLAYDPVAFLIVPRLLAAIVMLPALVVLADAMGVVERLSSSSVDVTDVTPPTSSPGSGSASAPSRWSTSLLKAMMFGARHRVRLLL